MTITTTMMIDIDCDDAAVAAAADVFVSFRSYMCVLSRWMALL